MHMCSAPLLIKLAQQSADLKFGMQHHLWNGNKISLRQSTVEQNKPFSVTLTRVNFLSSTSVNTSKNEPRIGQKGYKMLISLLFAYIRLD